MPRGGCGGFDEARCWGEETVCASRRQSTVAAAAFPTAAGEARLPQAGRSAEAHRTATRHAHGAAGAAPRGPQLLCTPNPPRQQHGEAEKAPSGAARPQREPSRRGAAAPGRARTRPRRGPGSAVAVWGARGAWAAGGAGTRKSPAAAAAAAAAGDAQAGLCSAGGACTFNMWRAAHRPTRCAGSAHVHVRARLRERRPLAQRSGADEAARPRLRVSPAVARSPTPI